MIEGKPAGTIAAGPAYVGTEPEPGFGVYVHCPFCLAKCPYCDFNSHVRHQPVEQKRYAKALARELEHQAQLARDKKISSIFFGGGTPSLMQPQTIATVLEAIASLWPFADDVEITM